MLYERNRIFLLIWRILIFYTFCLLLQNAIPCSSTSHFAKDNVNEWASHANNIKEFILNDNNDNNIAPKELDQMISMLQNVNTNIIFVTDYVFAPAQSSGGYAYSIAQPSSLPTSSFTCIATTHTYVRPFTFAEFMQSFTILYEFECESREDYASQMNWTMCSGKYEVNGQYGWLNLRSSCFVLSNETSNDSTDATTSSSSSSSKKKECIWKFESLAKNCIEGEKEALFVVDAIKNEESCPSAKTADNKQSCPSENIRSNSTRYTTNVIFQDFINDYLPRRELLHETIADGVDFVTSVLVTRIALREALEQLETNVDTDNYMDDTVIYQRNVFNEWLTHFLNYYAPRMHTKWKHLQQFAQETITSALISGELLLREYSNKETSINNIYTSKSNSSRENVNDCANGEVYDEYKRSNCKDNTIYNTKMLSTEPSSVIFQNSKFICPLVDELPLFNVSLELSLEKLNASLFAEQTLQTLENFLEQVQTINLQEKAQGVQLLQIMFCFSISHLITSIAMLDETFVTAELTIRTLQPLEHTFDWLLEYLERLDIAKSLAELNEFYEHIRTTKQKYLSLMHASLGVTFVDCVFNVINASTPIISQSTPSLKEFNSSEYHEYNEVIKPVPLNTCVEPILQAYRLLPDVSVDTEVNWSFEDENVKNDIVDEVNNLVQHSYHFTVNNSNKNNNNDDDDDDDDNQINTVTISTVSEYIKGDANQEIGMTEYCDKRTLNENVNVCENELDECGYFSPALLFPSYTNVTLPIGYATMNSDCDDVNETCTCDLNTTDNIYNMYCKLPNFTNVIQELLCEPGTYFAMNTQSCLPCKVLQFNAFDESNEYHVNNKQGQEFNKTMIQMMMIMMMMKMGISVEFDNTFTDLNTTLLTQRTIRQVKDVTSADVNAPLTTSGVVSGAFSFCPGDGEMHQCPRLTSNNAVYAEAVQDVNRTLPQTACRYYCNHSRFAPLHNDCTSTPQYYLNTSTWHTERCVLSELIYRSGGAGVVVGSGVANIVTSCPVMLREKYWSNTLHSKIANEFLPFVRCQLHNSFSSSSSSSSSSCTMNEMSTMWTIELSSINFTLLRAMHIAAGKANACETNKENHEQSEEEEDFSQYNSYDKKTEDLSNLFKQEQLLKPTQVKHLLASFRPKDSTNDFEEIPYWSFYLVTMHSQEQLSNVYTAYFYLETNTVYTSFSTTNSKALHINSDTIIHVRQGSTLSDNLHSSFSVRDVGGDDICSEKDNIYKENVEYSIYDADEENEQIYSAIKSDEEFLSKNDTMTMWNWSIMWERSDRGKSVRFFVNDMQIGAAIPVRLRENFLKQSNMSTRPMHLAFGGEVAFSMANESLQFTTHDRNNFYKSNYHYCEYEHDNMNNNNNNSKWESNINSTSCCIIVPLPAFADFMPAKMIAFTRTFNAQLQTEKLARVSFSNIRRQREQLYNNTIRYLEKLNVRELLSYSSFSTDEMWSRSAQLINFATAITQSMSHACRSGYGVNGKVAKKLPSDTAASNATLCLPCPLASYTEIQYTSHSTTWLNFLQVNQSICTCIDTWQWRNSSMTCILRAIGNGQPYMKLEHTTFVIPDNVTCRQCLEEQRMYESLTSYATPSQLSNPNTSYILLGWGAVLMPSNVPNTYLPDVNEQRVRKSYECSSNAVRIDSYESVNDAFFRNNIILYSSAASGLASETCRIYLWVSTESSRPSMAINRTVEFVMRPNSLMPWNVNVKNLTSAVYNQRVLVTSITDYNMLPEFSLQSILKLQQLSANEIAIITQTLQNTIVQLEVNCSDAHMPEQSQNAMSKHASYIKLKMFFNDIIEKHNTNNVINTSFANDKTVNIFNSVYYSHGLIFISLTSADDACMFTWTVRSNSSAREKIYDNIKDDNDVVDGDDGTSPFIVSHGLRIVTLPWRVHTSFQWNATAVNTKWITSTNNEFTISSIHLQLDITSIAQNSDLITVAFILVTFIVLLMYYRNSHTSTRRLLLNAKATS